MIIIVATCLHVVAAIFWAGSTMTLACSATPPSRRFFLVQMAIALTAVAAGGVLWCRLHAGVFQAMEQVLAVAAACALVALLAQLTVVGQAVLSGGAVPALSPRAAARVALSYRASAALLLLAGAAMAIAKYAGSMLG